MEHLNETQIYILHASGKWRVEAILWRKNKFIF